MTYSRFLELFPDNSACLEYLKDKFHPDGSECPSCSRATKFHRLRGRAAYSCQYCGHQIYPTAGTIFHRSTTSLQLWFWAIYLMSSTRCGISAKQLEREIGVTYKTAHRMFKLIRSLLSEEDDGPLGGEVEADETFHGGKPRAHVNKDRKAAARRKYEVKAQVFAMAERRGRVRAWVVDDRTKPTLHGMIRRHVLPDSMIFTDEYRPYVGIERHFKGHRRINHRAGVYVEGDTHTQTIEGFFGLFKNGVRGVYHSVSAKYLQNYLDEYAFRYNRRFSKEPMFWAMLNRVRKTETCAA